MNSYPFLFESSGDHRDLPSFPTRRSSDLSPRHCRGARPPEFDRHLDDLSGRRRGADLQSPEVAAAVQIIDRKSTRLNSSHSQISYAVFCLKKKKKQSDIALPPYHPALGPN